jgi:hypothetical protein
MLLTTLKFAAVGSEAFNLLNAAPRFGIDVKVTREQGLLFSRQYVTLSTSESNNAGMIYIGAFFSELVRLGRV